MKPSNFKIQLGRPKRLRRLERDEVLTQNGTKFRKVGQNEKCLKCGQHGHNQRTCDRRKQAKATKKVIVYLIY